MRKLLTASLLLAGCALQPASAQKTTVLHRKVATTKADYSSPAWVPNWVAAEFCEAYSRYFLALPHQYKYSASQALRNTPLADPGVNLTSMLAKDVTLREAVYKTIYQFCYSVKYDYDNSQEVDEIVHLMLYEDFHLSNLAATQLTMHINSRYRQPAPPILVDLGGSNSTPTGSGAYLSPIGEQGDRNGLRYAKATSGMSNSSSRPGSGGGSGFEIMGWRFDATPVVEAIDEEPGLIRFKIKINDKGEVESVTRMAGNVSPAQERLCRDKLLDSKLTKISPDARAATGFYTFRFSVR